MEIILAERVSLTDWAYECFQEGTIDALVDYDIEALNDMVKLSWLPYGVFKKDLLQETIEEGTADG